MRENNQQLPQISVLWEQAGVDGMWYPVPGMYGGFRQVYAVKWFFITMLFGITIFYAPIKSFIKACVD